MRAVVVFSKFPNVDETFILREAAALLGEGLDLRLLSLKPSHDAVVHDRARALLPRTAYLPWLSPAAVAATAWWALRRPGVVLSWAGWVLRAFLRSPGEGLRHLALTPKTMLFARRAARERVEYVHGFWATYPASAARLIGDLLGVAWGFSAHAHDIYGGNALLDEKLRRTRLVLTCTPENREHLRRRVPAADPRIVMMRHGLDLEQFAPEPPPPRASRLRVLCPGTLVLRKGQHLLVRAVAGLVREGVDCELTLVGDEGTDTSAGDRGQGSQRERVERLAAELGLGDRVRVVGFTRESEMPAHYRACHVVALLALPGLHFGLPNVLLEAMASARPFVVTPLPAVLEALPGTGAGIVLEASDEDGIVGGATAALRRLAADPAAAAAMGERGRAAVQEWDLRSCGRAIARRFAEAAGLPTASAA